MATADEDFSRSTRLLFLSGLAAGLSIGLSFVARAALTGAVPSDTTGLIGNILYPLGFILIVGGRYQLFTENTLTPVTHVLTRIASIPTLPWPPKPQRNRANSGKCTINFLKTKTTWKTKHC